MKVKLLKRMAGPRGNFSPGAIFTCATNAEAAELIECGAAVPVMPAPEKAVPAEAGERRSEAKPARKRAGARKRRPARQTRKK